MITLENCLAVSYKVKYNIPYDSAILPWVLPKREENKYLQKELYESTYSSFGQNSQSGNRPNVINRITDQQIVV